MKKPGFRVKICGVKTAADIAAVAASGGDAVGLNCFANSARYVTEPIGRMLCRSSQQSGVLPIALFVNASLDQIYKIRDDWGITTVQLHGDEDIEYATQLLRSGLQVLKAVRLPTGPLDADEIERRVVDWELIGCSILLDADVGSAFGGVGTRLDWKSIDAWGLKRQDNGRVPQFTLAGGLKSEHLAEAIHQCRPAAVDVASGVEKEKGVKDSALIEQFCRLALDALN